MDSTLRQNIAALLAAGRAHDAGESSHAARYLNLEGDTAELLALLIELSGRRSVLEIGTSNGVSALWIADALSRTGGHLISLERDAGKQAEAAAHLAEAGLAERVTMRCGEATALVGGLSGPFDCVFFDADRVSAPTQLLELLPRISRPALLLADNALSHPEEIAGYLEAVGRLTGATSTVVPVGKGLSVTWLR